MRILFETGNPGKLGEVQAKFAPLGIVVEQLEDEAGELPKKSSERASLLTERLMERVDAA
jgi:inosine/xanthosine triphosphate pyrophosphatase family protein